MYATQTKKERRDRITFYKGGERQGRITFYKGGNRCVLDFENKSGKAPRSSFHGGLKAPTYGLSDAARSYMRDLLSQLDSDELVTAGIFWIRLSVPKKLWDEGFKRVKDHQKRLFKKIQRRYGDLGCIWRLELANKDGGFSPHIHVIMIFSGASSSCLRKFIEDTWPASTRTVRVNSSRYLDRIKRYIAKKERITETHTGKAWGIFCKEMVDSFIHPITTTEPIPEDKAVKARRWLARLSRRKLGERFYTQRIFVPYQDIRRMLKFLGLEECALE